MQEPPPRVATLVVVTAQGDVIGALPPVEVETPWWQDVAPIVGAARDRFGADVTILRVLETELPMAHGGAVTYLAETSGPVETIPWLGVLDEQPLRQTWARPGGPDADLAWARSMLSGLGLPPTGPPVQVRSWNLSSLWRLPVEGQTAWLKVVPPFLAHEGAMLESLQGRDVPRLLAHDGARTLLAEIPGDDLYDADVPRQLEMVTLLVGLQREFVGRTDELLVLGLPDWRAGPLASAIASVVERVGHEMAGATRTVLDGFVDGLASRLAAVAASGLPDTLVHGDFHPGNLRGDAETLVLLDWGDCGVGHPLLDEPAFLEAVPPDSVALVREHWHRAWRTAVPGSDPERAAALLAPVAAARQAMIYQQFLDHIEPSEHAYHRDDPRTWLERTASLVRAEPG